MLHDVQRILRIGIEGSLPAEPTDGEWKLALAGLFGEPMSELRRKGISPAVVSTLVKLCRCAIGPRLWRCSVQPITWLFSALHC